jgi:hypothetical protein
MKIEAMSTFKGSRPERIKENIKIFFIQSFGFHFTFVI